MADDFTGLGGQGPDMKRLLVAVILMTGTLMVFNLFFAPPRAPEPAQVATGNPVPKVQEAPKAAALEANKNIVATPENIPEQIKQFSFDLKAAKKEHTTVALRGGYNVQVTNQGAQIRAIDLTGYKKPIHLSEQLIQGVGLFAIASRDVNLTLAKEAPYELVSSSDTDVIFQRVTPEGVRVKRKYHFYNDRFLTDQTVELTNEGKAVRQIALDVLLAAKTHSKEEVSGGYLTPGVEEIASVCRVADKRHRVSVEDLHKSAFDSNGSVAYAGFDQRYFLTAFVPKGDVGTEGCTISLAANGTSGNYALIAIHQKPMTVMPGETKTLLFAGYYGPKQLTLLKEADSQLEENVDFGWFGVLSRPMLWLLEQLFRFVGNFGLAIILLTLLIKLLTFPLTQKSFVSMQEMKKIAPHVKELQQKYSHDRTLLGQKQMELYKEKGINPMAGCLPMLIQMPVWFALYQMLWNSVELYQRPFGLWIFDLTQPDPFFVLPVAMGASMFIQQAFQPPIDDQPQMKYVMWGMPIFLTFIMLKLPAGLSLYIFTNNILTIGQQLYIKQRYPS